MSYQRGFNDGFLAGFNSISPEPPEAVQYNQSAKPVYCPLCGQQSLRHIEHCEPPDPDTRKDTWTCDCHFARKTRMVLYTFLSIY